MQKLREGSGPLPLPASAQLQDRTIPPNLPHGLGISPVLPSEKARRAALPGWLHTYNRRHRRHSAIGKVPPITRLTNVHEGLIHQAVEHILDKRARRHPEQVTTLRAPRTRTAGRATPAG
jgi:hypothetical protein